MLAFTIQEKLKSLGIHVSGLPNKIAFIDPGVRFEPPCSLDIGIVPAQPLEVGAFTHINGGFIKNAKIGRYCSIARDVQIGHGSHPTDWLSVSPLQYWDDYRGWNSWSAGYAGGVSQMNVRDFNYAALTTIGNDVWLGNHVIVLDGVSIGHGAVVAANSVVTRNVEPYAIVAGSPAKIIRKRFPDGTIERLLASEWWNYRLPDLQVNDFSDIDRTLREIETSIADGRSIPYTPSWISLSDLIDTEDGNQ